MAVRNKTYTEAERYIAWVMWVVGFSEKSIAVSLGIRRKQVAGLVNRSPYPNRSAMSDAERQAALNDLLSMRTGEDGKPIDGGRLVNVPTTIVPLRKAQKRG